MKGMNKSIVALLLFLGASAGLSVLPGCDVIDNPVPEQATVSAGRRDTLALDSAESAQPAATPVQRALLEDFTGQYCGNCPRAGLVAASLDQQYGERLVVLEAHVTDYFAAPKTNEVRYQTDFRAPTVSQELNDYFGLELLGLPNGAVNRAPISGATSQLVGFSNWGTAVATQLAQTPQQDLRVTRLYNAATRKVRLKISSRYLTAQPSRTFRLGIYVSEDSLLGWQKDYTRNPADVANYAHRHVLRTALSGTFGQIQALNPTAGQTFATYLTYDLPATWQDKHCAIVAFLADDATKQIVQVAEVKVK